MENQNTLTMEQAINKDTIDYSTNDFYKPDFNLNVSNEINMEEAVKRQSLNADILDSLKPKDEINYGASVVEGFKQAGKRFSNTISDAIDSVKLMTKNVDWFYPNMTEQERNDMALEIALTKKANKSYDAMMQHYNGTDNMITMGCGAIAQFLGQMGLNMIVPGLGSAQVGIQTVTDTAIDYAVDVMEKEGYNVEKVGNWKDNAITIANGAVQTFIEHKLGAERIVNGAFSKAMTGTLKAGATTAFSEGSEEFVQEWAGYLFNTMAGHEDRTVGQVLNDSLTSAVVGGLIGGIAGSSNYKLKTLDVAKVLREKFGISDPKLANAMAQDMVDSVLNGAKEEMTIQAQFKYHYGENYDKFVAKVKNLLQESGWKERNPDKDLDKFAQLNADTLITPFINMANMSNMTAKDFFDVANMEVIGNQVVLDTRRFDNPNEIRRRIKRIDEQLKEENLIQGKNRTKQKQRLQSQKKTLQLILRKLNFEEMFDKEAITNNLAKIQQSEVEKQNPQIVGSLNGIQEDWNFNNKGMYVGKHRIPVNMLVMDLKDINISHIDGEENPNYKNKALQNRVHNNINDSVRIQQKSNNLQPESLVFGNDTTTGSPVINLDGDVIAGNNRSELLRRAYINQDQVPGLKERVEAYKNLLKQQGYNIDGMEMPILVRQVDLTPEQQVAVATVSNIPTISAFQHSQRARNDAKAISNKGLTTPEAFLQNLTTDEKVEFELEKGNIDRLALDRRFNDAVMSLILDDNKLFESLILGNKLPKKIISAISNTAKTSNLLEKIKTDPKFKNDLKEALILASKTDINNLAMNMQQAEVGQDTPFNKNALLLLFTSGNMTQISDGLDGYITRINTQMDLLSNDSMFKNDIPVYSQEDLMKQTLKDIALTKGYFTEDGQVKKDLKDPKQQKMVENLLALFTSESPSKSGTIEQQIIDEEDNRLFQSDNQEYTQETITIDGVEKPALNSEGNYLGRTEEEIRNFYKWFGDSKVVDEEGKPLVVYHGTSSDFDTFNTKYIFTSSSLENASMYGSKGAMPIYVKLNNPYIVDAYGQNFGEIYNAEGKKKKYKDLTETDYQKIANEFFDGNIQEAKEMFPKDWDGEINLARSYGEKPKSTNEWAKYAKDKGFDGLIIKDVIDSPESFSTLRANDYVAFNSNQIKSVENKGIYSPDTGNIYYQEDNRNFVATHNIDKNAFKNAIKLGGLAMPSMAITNLKNANANTAYGEITLIGNEDLVKPSRNVDFFLHDAYSPTLSNFIRYSLSNNAKSFIKDTLKKVNRENSSSTFIYNIEEELKYPTSNSMAMELYAIDKNIENDDSTIRNNPDYLEWYQNNLQGEPYLWVENSRKTNMVRKEFNLENAIKALKTMDRQGNNIITPNSVNLVLQAITPKLKSIKEAHKKEFLLSSFEESDNYRRKLNEKFAELSKELSKDDNNSFFDLVEGLGLALTSKTDEEKIKWLSQRKMDTSENALQKIKDFQEEIINTPTTYFEAKIRKAVNLNEFKGIILPNTTDYDNIANYSKDVLGLNVKRINTENTEEYKQALNEINNESNIFFQNSRYNGFFDADLKTILLGENMNEGTLQHEVAHFFLDRCFEIWQNGTGTKQFNERFQQIADMLGIDENQAKLTTGQQEQWARMTEAYLFGKGMPADRLPLMDQFMQWIPAQYQTIEDLQYMGDDGQLHNPLISKESAEIFDRLYTLGYTEESTTGNSFNNPTNKDDKYLPVDVETQKAREKILNDGATKSEVPTFNMKEFAQNLEEYQPEVKEEPKPETMTGKAKQFVNKVLAGRGTNTREQMTKDAQDYISKNRQHAEEIAFSNPIDGEPDFVYNDSGIDRVILTREVAKLYSNDRDTYSLLMAKAAIARQIASKSAGLTNDWNTKLFMDGYQQMIKSAKDKVFLKRYGNKGDINQLEVDMNNIINKWASRIAQAQGINQASVIAEANADIRKEFDIDTDIFFQEDFIKDKKSSSLAKYGISKLKQALGIEPSAEDISKLQTLSDLALSTVNDIDNPDIEKSIQAVKNFKAYKEFIESKKIPQTTLDKITTDWSSNAMLSNPSTILMSNIVPNTVEYELSKASLRAYYGKNVVDEDLKKQAIDKIAKIYQATGEDLSQMAQLKDKTLLLGEVYNPEKPKTWYKLPTRLVGAENAWFRRRVFINTLSHIASKNAKGNIAKANELFKSYLNIANQTEEGQKARLEAVLNGELVTFTNNGKLAQAMVKVRQLLNSVSVNYKGGRVVFGDGTGIKLGQLLMPFPKTPSNIVQIGFNAALAPATILYRTFTLTHYSFADVSNITHFAAGLLGYIICSWLDIKYNPQKNKYDPAGDTIEIGGVKMKISLLGPASSAFRSIYSLLNAKGDVDSMINTGLSSLPVFDTMDNLTMAKEHTAQWFNNFMANNVNKMLIPGLLRYPANYLGGFTGYKTNSKWEKPWVRGLGMTRSKSNIEKFEDVIIKSLFGRYVQF